MSLVLSVVLCLVLCLVSLYLLKAWRMTIGWDLRELGILSLDDWKNEETQQILWRDAKCEIKCVFAVTATSPSDNNELTCYVMSRSELVPRAGTCRKQPMKFECAKFDFMIVYFLLLFTDKCVVCTDKPLWMNLPKYIVYSDLLSFGWYEIYCCPVVIPRRGRAMGKKRTADLRICGCCLLKHSLFAV